LQFFLKVKKEKVQEGVGSRVLHTYVSQNFRDLSEYSRDFIDAVYNAFHFFGKIG